MMAMLEDCADEILLEIITRLYRPDHLASLSLTCRRLRNLVHPVLLDSKSYRSLDLGRLDPCGLPSAPFRSILKRPNISCYVLNACVEFHDSEAGVNRYRRKKALNPDILSESEEVQLWERAVEELGILGWEGGHSMVEALSKGSQGARVALSLLMHRNLESLDIKVNGDDRWIRWAIYKVVSSAHLHPSRLSNYGFHALREVSFTDNRWVMYLLRQSSFYRLSLYSLAPFFLLPSIESISGNEVSQIYEFKWDGPYGVSNVTHLRFDHSNINDQALEMLLRIPKALKSFSYNFGGEGSESEDFHYDKILDIVARTQSGLDKSNIHVDTYYP